MPRAGVLMMRRSETSSCGDDQQPQVRQHVAHLLAIVERHAAHAARRAVLVLRSSVSNSRGCSLVRNRMAKSLRLGRAVGDAAANVVDHALGLGHFVLALQDLRLLAAGQHRPQYLVVPRLVVRDQPVGQRQDRRRRAIVLFQPHDLGLGPIAFESAECAPPRPRASRRSTGRRRPRRTSCDARRPRPARCGTAWRWCPDIRRSAGERIGRPRPCARRQTASNSSSVHSSRSSKSTAPACLSAC